MIRESIPSFQNPSPEIDGFRRMQEPAYKHQLSFGRIESRSSPGKNSFKNSNWEEQSAQSETIKKLEDDHRMYRDNLAKATEK